MSNFSLGKIGWHKAHSPNTRLANFSLAKSLVCSLRSRRGFFVGCLEKTRQTSAIIRTFQVALLKILNPNQKYSYILSFNVGY